MDLGNSSVKTPEPESETPTRIQPPPPPPPLLTNGLLKRHAPLGLGHPVVVAYRECLKNHAAALGGHALDGCGEFMPSPASDPSDPTSLKCAACGCHRNFHRRDPDAAAAAAPSAVPAIEYQPHHRHRPPPPHSGSSPNDSPSPPPISSAYYPSSAPHMLLALSHGLPPCPPPPPADHNHNSTPPISAPSAGGSGGRKRFRTKFSQEQKEKMLEVSDRVGWKMQKRDDDVINEMCNEIGVDRSVFKVWMHNNKNTFGKKESNPSPPANGNGNGEGYVGAQGTGCQPHHRESTSVHALGTITNGSSSTSIP